MSTDDKLVPIAKLGAVWGFLGVSSWADLAYVAQAFAAFMAALVSILVAANLIMTYWKNWRKKQ